MDTIIEGSINFNPFRTAGAMSEESPTNFDVKIPEDTIVGYV